MVLTELIKTSVSKRDKTMSIGVNIRVRNIHHNTLLYDV